MNSPAMRFRPEIKRIYNELRETSDSQKSKELCERMLEFGAGRNRLERVLMYGGLTKGYSAQFNHDEAIRYAEKGQQESVKLKDLRERAFAAQTLATVLYHSGDMARALEWYEAAAELAREAEDEDTLATCLKSLCIVSAWQTRYQRAIEAAQEARAIFARRSDKRGLAGVLMNMGNYFIDIGLYQDAIAAYEEVVTLFHELGNKVMVAGALCNIGLAYCHQEATELAHSYYQRAYAVITQTNDLSFRYNIVLNLLATSKILNLLDDADRLYQELVPLADQIGTPNSLLTSREAGARLSLMHGEADAALRLLKEVEHLIDQQQADHKWIYSERRAEAHAALGQHADAYEWQMKSARFKDETQKTREKGLQSYEADLRQALEKQMNHVITLKEREVANSTLQLVAQTELFDELREDLMKIARKIPPSEPAAKELRERLNALPERSVDWVKFEAQFNSVHPEFTSKLLATYPDLSPTEVRHCLLLRINLKSSEAARLLCLSERTVEHHRFSIRRKLGIKRNDSLSSLLSAI
jgi:tetratricopeptide (TPR) repeat protein